MIERRAALRILGVGGLAVMGFANDVIGGAAALIRAAIKSPNYVAGSTGWSINKDGSAEFNNVTVRGTIKSGQFIGTGTGNEILIYSGTPAANNLIASVTSTASTDAQGNSVPAGFTTYATILGVYYALVTSGTEMFLFSGASQASWTTQQGYMEFLASPQATEFILPLLLASQAATPAAAAAGALMFADANDYAAYVAGLDGQKYNVGHTEVSASGQNITSTSFATVTGSTFTLEQATYRLTYTVFYTGTQAAGTPLFRVNGTAVISGVHARYKYITYPTTLAASGHLTTMNTTMTGPTLLNGTVQEFEVELFLSVGTAGNMSLLAADGTNGDTFTVSAMFGRLERRQ